ncbi:MAG: cytochrome C oxidase subunit III [Campylobacter sp.]|nr:cytochrome C oxidase subunit III [Campylobacter sp.]
MRNLIFLLAFFGVCLCAESFITDEEYGAMLYQNPRGIGCDKCHGERGEGQLIAKYEEFNRSNESYYEKSLFAPKINTLSLQELADGIGASKDIMPSYFLTKDEIIIIYKYLKAKNQTQKKDENDKQN